MKLITPDMWTRAEWIGRTPGQDNIKYKAEKGIPTWDGRRNLPPPSSYPPGSWEAIQHSARLRDTA